MVIKKCPIRSASLQTDGFGVVDIDVFESFESIEHDWRELETAGVCSIYQRFDWVKGWAKNVGLPARMLPRLVLGCQNGEPLFILALGLRRRGPFTIAMWLGDSHSNFNMGIYSTAFIKNACPDDVRNIVRCVSQNIGKADILELCCQPVVLQGYTNPFTYLRWQESHNHAFALDISEGFETALDRKNGARKRKKHRWQNNRLKEVGGARLKVATTEQEVDDFLDVSFKHMARRFDRAGIWNRCSPSAFMRQRFDFS